MAAETTVTLRIGCIDAPQFTTPTLAEEEYAAEAEKRRGMIQFVAVVEHEGAQWQVKGDYGPPETRQKLVQDLLAKMAGRIAARVAP